MPFAFLKYGLRKQHPGQHHFTPTKPLKSHYDVVIIGAGGHGCSIAYYLAKHPVLRILRSSTRPIWVGAIPRATRR